MSPAIRQILEHVSSWPQKDQQELAEVARDIEARRAGKYFASKEELRAVDDALASGVASGDEVDAAFRSFRGK